jgi:hypothetical protein
VTCYLLPRRWFVLTGGMLAYYRGTDDAIPAGRIPLSGAEIRDAVAQNGFNILTQVWVLQRLLHGELAPYTLPSAALK